MHWWTPRPNDRCLEPLRVISNESAFSKAVSSRLAEPVSSMTPSPVRILRPRRAISARAIRKSVLSRKKQSVWPVRSPCGYGTPEVPFAINIEAWQKLEQRTGINAQREGGERKSDL